MYLARSLPELDGVTVLSCLLWVAEVYRLLCLARLSRPCRWPSLYAQVSSLLGLFSQRLHLEPHHEKPHRESVALAQFRRSLHLTILHHRPPRHHFHPHRRRRLLPRPLGPALVPLV